MLTLYIRYIYETNNVLPTERFPCVQNVFGESLVLHKCCSLGRQEVWSGRLPVPRIPHVLLHTGPPLRHRDELLLMYFPLYDVMNTILIIIMTGVLIRLPLTDASLAAPLR